MGLDAAAADSTHSGLIGCHGSAVEVAAAAVGSADDLIFADNDDDSFCVRKRKDIFIKIYPKSIVTCEQPVNFLFPAEVSHDASQLKFQQELIKIS